MSQGQAGGEDRRSQIDEWIQAASAKPVIESEFQPQHKRKSLWGWLLGFFRTKDMSPEDILLDGIRFDHQLKKLFAFLIIVAVVGQIIVADVLLVMYLSGRFDPAADSAVLIAWFSAGVVEIVGLMAIVTRYLFPSLDGKTDPDKKRKKRKS